MKNIVIKVFALFIFVFLFVINSGRVFADSACGSRTCPDNSDTSYSVWGCSLNRSTGLCYEPLLFSNLPAKCYKAGDTCLVEGGYGIPPSGCKDLSPPCEMRDVNRHPGCCPAAPPDSCFPAGTKVFMGDGGQKSIEDVKVGDKVVSQSEAGKRSVSTVTKLDQPVRDHMCQIKFTDGENLKLTDEHPLFTQDGWKAINPKNTFKEVPNLPVSELKKGDRVSKSDGTSAEVGSFGCWSEKIQTYNLILDNGANTYFADGFLVHNKGEAPINGVCAATHDICSTGTSANPVDGATAWTWDCNGSYSGTNAVGCTENKTGTVQGCKVLGTNSNCYESANSPFSAKILKLDGSTTESLLGNSQAWSYAFSGVSAGSHTVSTSVPSGYISTGYSRCDPNTTGCHINNINGTGTAAVTVPAGGYIDLWWHYTPSPSTCSITSITPGSVVSGTVGSTIVTYTGTVSPAAQAQDIRLFLERRNGQPVSNGTISPLVGTSGNYYQVAGCTAGTGGTCTKTVTVTAPPGGYYFHCDVATDPGKCSGNPFCPYEDLGGTADCSGWQSCSNSDNGTFDVYGIPNCNGLTGPSSIILGDSGTYSAIFSSEVANIPQKIEFADHSITPILSPPSGNWQNGVASLTTNVISGNSGYGSVTWTPSAIGSYDVFGRAWNDGHAECRGNSDYVDGIPRYTCAGMCRMPVKVNPVAPWWQVVDGDVSTNGSLNSFVPDTATEPYFDTIGAGGYPGIPAYGGSMTNPAFSYVSETHWKANSSASTKEYKSNYFLGAIPSDVTPKQIGSSITSADFDFKPANFKYDYYWYKYDGAPPLTINGNINFGTKKVILIVKQANVTLNGKINLDDGSGFFLLVTGGNIIVDSGVANLEGIFVADNKFITGTKGSDPGTDSQLWIRGTVAAYGGVDLRRNLGAGNSTTPAEKFEFAPDLDLLFPNVLGARLMNWQEVAP